MRFTTWPVAALGLASLLLLIVVSVLESSRRAEDIFARLDEINAHHRSVETRLRRLRSDVHLSGIFVRDYLMDTSRERAPEYRHSLAEFRQRNLTTAAELRQTARSHGESETNINSLQAKLEDYWQTFEPLIDWTTAEKASQSITFLRREVLPRREAVLSIAQEIEELNNANLSAQRAAVLRQEEEFRGALQQLLWGAILLGLLVALTAVIRLRILERRSEQQRSVAQQAEHQMRQLSQQLVATQEEERRKLSRELHDHVGQMLTALRMELGRVERLKPAGDTRLPEALSECRRLVDGIVRSVRDLALGLRPSMLDDFGLEAALEWQARDFTRRYGIPVELAVNGLLDALPDQHRTCVYRVVQEALTNCIRHARATRIRVAVKGHPRGLEVSVIDDGIGVDPRQRSDGLGLRGIEERVRELGGSMAISGTPDAGTTLTIQLPVAAGEAEARLARAAG